MTTSLPNVLWPYPRKRSGQKERTEKEPHLQCDSVVDDHGLAEDVGAVLGVGQFGVEIQSEVFIIIHFFVSQHNHGATFLP